MTYQEEIDFVKRNGWVEIDHRAIGYAWICFVHKEVPGIHSLAAAIDVIRKKNNLKKHFSQLKFVFQ